MPKVSLFYGEEDFLIDEEIRGLKAGTATEFNFERIDGTKSSLEQIIFALSSIPMLGGTRLVVIDGFECEEGGEEKLYQVLQSLDKNIKAVFVNYGSMDKRKKFFKLMEKTGEIKEFKRLSEWEQDKALAWIVNRVKHYGKKIGSHAANLLIEIAGLNLRMLDKEIEKLSTYTGERELIEKEDVLNLASSGEMDAFVFSNAVRDKDPVAAMKSLNRLFKDNEDPHMLIGMISRLYRMLLQVKCLEDEGMDNYQIASRLKAKPFFVKKCQEKTGNFSRDELINNIKLLHITDLKLKSGASPRLALEMLVPELCHGYITG